jgi:CDP-diacylglycerol--glycerol-3-phosphate 3-phosphatidyltransferase
MSYRITITDKILAKTFLKLLPKWVTPNHVTIFRFLTIPFVILLLVAQQYALGLALFIISAFTDALDGALARTTNQVTDWGKMFDPLADKLLIGTVVAIMVTKYLGVGLAFVIISIEAFLILNGYYKKKYQHRVIQAEKTGKFKMILQSFGVGILLLYVILLIPILLIIAEYIFYLAIFFALWSLIVYKSI